MTWQIFVPFLLRNQNFNWRLSLIKSDQAKNENPIILPKFYTKLAVKLSSYHIWTVKHQFRAKWTINLLKAKIWKTLLNHNSIFYVWLWKLFLWFFSGLLLKLLVHVYHSGWKGNQYLSSIQSGQSRCTRWQLLLIYQI